MYWEHHLAQGSQFAEDIGSLFRFHGLPSPYDIVPDLDSNLENQFPYVGTQKYIEVEPISDLISEKEAQSIGSLIALAVTLGVGDLHRENIIFGISDGHFRFFFSDIEVIFSRFFLPSQSLLVTKMFEPEIRIEDSGLFDLFSHRSFTIQALKALIVGYFNGIRLLASEGRGPIRNLFELASQVKPPIRAVIRQTSTYAGIRSNEETANLLFSESEQLQRGDIPYFFRSMTESGIRYYTDPEWGWSSIPEVKNYYEAFRLAKPTLGPQEICTDLNRDLNQRALEGCAQIVECFGRIRGAALLEESASPDLFWDSGYLHLILNGVDRIKWKSQCV